MKAVAIVVLAITGCATQMRAGANSEPAVTWTIYAGYQPIPGQPPTATPTLMQGCDPTTSGCTASAIIGDGSVYSDGSTGVSNCVIHIGVTYDATIAISSPRNVSFNLQHQVASLTSSQPPWSTSTVAGGGFLNVSHILQGTTLGSPAESDYSTRFTSALPFKGAYHLRMDNPAATEPTETYYGSYNYNYPFTTALVWVHHCPDTRSGYSSSACPAGHKESWYVYPDAGGQLSPTGAPVTQVSTLVTGTSPIIGIAQYSTPFFFKIELQ